MNTYIKITDNFLNELLEEPETEPEAKPIKEKPYLVRFYEAYKMLTNPEKFKFDQLRKREAKKKEMFSRGLGVLRETLG